MLRRYYAPLLMLRASLRALALLFDAADTLIAGRHVYAMRTPQLLRLYATTHVIIDIDAMLPLMIRLQPR